MSEVVLLGIGLKIRRPERSGLTGTQLTKQAIQESGEMQEGIERLEKRRTRLDEVRGDTEIGKGKYERRNWPGDFQEHGRAQYGWQ